MNDSPPRRIYLDYAAATPVDPRVVEAMRPYWTLHPGNAGGLHQEGRDAKHALTASREVVARVVGAQPDEVVFTSGGTEANALAMLGTVRAVCAAEGGDIRGVHIITTRIEHPSVLEGFRALEQQGAQVDYLSVDRDGMVDLTHLKEVLTPLTTLVSVMYVNNEVGTIQPIAEIAKLIRRVKKEAAHEGRTKSSYPIFHTDASQAPLYLPLLVQKLGVDLLTIDGQKIYGPKGIGALYVRRGTPLEPLFLGGSQERGVRPGTEPIPLIVGLSTALTLAEEERAARIAHVTPLRDLFLALLEEHNKRANQRGGTRIEINGPVGTEASTKRLPNNINVSIPGYESEYLILALDHHGIAAASRSACMTGGSGSYVIEALGKDPAHAQSTLRFSLGKDTTEEDVRFVVGKILDFLTKQC